MSILYGSLRNRLKSIAHIVGFEWVDIHLVRFTCCWPGNFVER